MKPRFAFLFALMALTLSGCGNKGPLVQAPRKPAEEVPATETPPADSASEPASSETPAVDDDPVPDETELPAEPEPESPPADADGGG